MNLQLIRDVCKSVLPKATFHNEAGTKKDQYIVWNEEGQSSSSYADNRMQEQSITGTIDLYTKIEYDPLFDMLQVALKTAGITFRLESIQYEDQTKYTHYEWSWEVPNHIG
jgi:hypothetical protein